MAATDNIVGVVREAIRDMVALAECDSGEIAKAAVDALTAAGYAVVPTDDLKKMEAAYVLQEVRGGRTTEVPI